jgi:hypothetical protein
MDGILIEPKDETELFFINELLNKIGIKHSTFNVDELEDLALGLMMIEDEDDLETVSEEEMMKKLRSKC